MFDPDPTESTAIPPSLPTLVERPAEADAEDVRVARLLLGTIDAVNAMLREASNYNGRLFERMGDGVRLNPTRAALNDARHFLNAVLLDYQLRCPMTLDVTERSSP